MRTKAILLATIIFFSLTTFANPTPEEGKTIFSTRCAGCHNMNKDLVGPALAGLDQRRSMEWIIGFIQSSQTMVKSGDKDAVAVFEKFNRIPMPDHPDLTDDNIKSIVEYIKAESGGAAKIAVANTETDKPSITLSSYLTPGIIVTFSLLIVLLMTTIFIAVKVKSLEREMIRRKS